MSADRVPPLKAPARGADAITDRTAALFARIASLADTSADLLRDSSSPDPQVTAALELVQILGAAADVGVALAGRAQMRGEIGHWLQIDTAPLVLRPPSA